MLGSLADSTNEGVLLERVEIVGVKCGCLAAYQQQQQFYVERDIDFLDAPEIGSDEFACKRKATLVVRWQQHFVPAPLGTPT